jgi:hypothetical protein
MRRRAPSSTPTRLTGTSRWVLELTHVIIIDCHERAGRCHCLLPISCGGLVTACDLVPAELPHATC